MAALKVAVKILGVGVKAVGESLLEAGTLAALGASVLGGEGKVDITLSTFLGIPYWSTSSLG